MTKAATPRRVVHHTTVVERRFDAVPARVFAAWADAAERVKWDWPGEDWELAELKQTFRVGGRESARFGPKGHPDFWNDGRYLDIVANVRIVSAGTMHEGEARISATLCTIEFHADGAGTRLAVTDQSAFLDGRESPKERRSGWGTIFDRLEKYLASTQEKHDERGR